MSAVTVRRAGNSDALAPSKLAASTFAEAFGSDSRVFVVASDHQTDWVTFTPLAKQVDCAA